MEKTQSASISIIDRFAGVDDPRMEQKAPSSAILSGNRPKRTDPEDGLRSRGRSACRCAPRAARRRLRRLRIPHERAARRPGSGTERAPKTGRTGARAQRRNGMGIYGAVVVLA